MEALKKGDYVLATKYADGDAQDHFVVGFYDRLYKDRHIIIDADGHPFRASGFRRAEKISKKRGLWLVERLKDIESGSRNVWYYKTCSMRPSKAQKASGHE